MLVFEGCGRATIMADGGLLSSCVSTCSSHGVSNGVSNISNLTSCFGNGCCQSTFLQDRKSLTIHIDGLESRKNGDRVCGSGFLLDSLCMPSKYKDSEIVPMRLKWRCNDTCGDVFIPSPFGIGRECALTGWFNLECNSSRLYLPALDNLEVLGFNSREATITVNVTKTSACQNTVQRSKLLLNRTPFSFSGDYNKLVVEGCGSATIMDEDGLTVSGCSTICRNDTVLSNMNNCFGVGCCQSTIPFYLNSFTFNLTRLKRQDNGTCGSAVVMAADSYEEGGIHGQLVPAKLHYTQNLDFDQCGNCEENGGTCHFRPAPAPMYTCLYHGTSKTPVGVILGISISMGLLFLFAGIYALYKWIINAIAKRRKKKFLILNEGLLFNQQKANNIGLYDHKITHFKSDELKKATDNYNENRVIGRGGQGTVYKGMLGDGKIVAIKRSKVVTDQSQHEEIINEMLILSLVNHRNVVRLLGCCLETEVPLLVFEFISNGTLYDLLQDETNDLSFTLSMRLRIATEVATAVSYLHTTSSNPIYHRDIKTKNVLLDGTCRAKVSDFGISRFVSGNQTHLTTTVKGTSGYMDPEYQQTSRFTQKSDVYSFGVVLLELLTREKPYSVARFGENGDLVGHFKSAMEEDRLMPILDAKLVAEEGCQTKLLAVANLAMRCLNSSGRNRPTMKNVSIELERIRSS